MDTTYRNYTIRPVEAAGKTRYDIIDAAGNVVRAGLWGEAFAKQAIDALIARNERAALEPVSATTAQPEPETTVERKAANAKKMGRHENNPNDLI